MGCVKEENTGRGKEINSSKKRNVRMSSRQPNETQNKETQPKILYERIILE